MTFLMMLSVILLSMLMIQLSILSVIRHLICGNNLNWLLNLNLNRFPVCWNLFCASFSCNSMPCSNFSTLHGVNPNLKKKSASSFGMEVARHVESTQNRKLVIFLQSIKKKVLQLLWYYIAMQNIQICYGSPALFIVTCFTNFRNVVNFFYLERC